MQDLLIMTFLWMLMGGYSAQCICGIIHNRLDCTHIVSFRNFHIPSLGWRLASIFSFLTPRKNLGGGARCHQADVFQRNILNRDEIFYLHELFLVYVFILFFCYKKYSLSRSDYK